MYTNCNYATDQRLIADIFRQVRLLSVDVAQLQNILGANSEGLVQTITRINNDISALKTSVLNHKREIDDLTKTINIISNEMNNIMVAVTAASKAAKEASSDASQAKSDAAEALSKANSAVDDASLAISDASQAISDARTALSTANSAKSDAAEALSTAKSAASDASRALADASSAISDASSAASDASTALTTANEAASDASTALTTANEASSTANQAQTDASTALTTAKAAKKDASESLKKADEAIPKSKLLTSTSSSETYTDDTVLSSKATDALIQKYTDGDKSYMTKQEAYSTFVQHGQILDVWGICDVSMRWNSFSNFLDVSGPNINTAASISLGKCPGTKYTNIDISIHALFLKSEDDSSSYTVPYTKEELKGFIDNRHMVLCVMHNTHTDTGVREIDSIFNITEDTEQLSDGSFKLTSHTDNETIQTIYGKDLIVGVRLSCDSTIDFAAKIYPDEDTFSFKYINESPS